MMNRNAVPLTPETIVDAAIALADADGLESVTIRRVARALGVTPMALYWHFAKKDDLLDGMVDRVYREMDLSLVEDACWRDQLRALVDAQIAILREHPPLATLLLTRTPMSSHALNAIDVALGVLRRGGFSPAEAVQIVRHIEQTIVHLVSREPGHADTRNHREMEAQERQAIASIRMLPPGLYPHVMEAAVPLSQCEHPQQQIIFGIDLLLAGIFAMADGVS